VTRLTHWKFARKNACPDLKGHGRYLRFEGGKHHTPGRVRIAGGMTALCDRCRLPLDARMAPIVIGASTWFDARAHAQRPHLRGDRRAGRGPPALGGYGRREVPDAEAGRGARGAGVSAQPSPAEPLWRRALLAREMVRMREENRGADARRVLHRMLRNAGQPVSLVAIRNWSRAAQGHAYLWAFAWSLGQENLPVPEFVERAPRARPSSWKKAVGE
jgi:hypothetical protein